MDGLKRLIGEVHRRSLWQVLGIYMLADPLRDDPRYGDLLRRAGLE